MTSNGFTVVAGSLGDQGGAVARVLHQQALPVRALSHDLRSPAARGLRAAGIEVLQDDLRVPEVVVKDVVGVTHVFGALTPFDEGGLAAETLQVRNLGWAAAQAGVERFVYSAVGDPDQDRDASPHDLWGVERLLQGFHLPLTLLRPAFFMENLDEFALRRQPTALWCCGCRWTRGTAVQWIAVADVGEFVRLAFEKPDAFGDDPVQLAGDEVTLIDALEMIGDALGADVRYERIALDHVTDQHAHGMYRWFQTYVHYHADIDALLRLHPEHADLPTLARQRQPGPVQARAAARGVTGILCSWHWSATARKRDFSETPEPGPDVKSSPGGNLFVIQKHAARRLHYDVRLELDGTLKSWAVPKGPSLDPNDKHLAVHVEDHPLDYADFEGIIPKGEYGGGTVMVWDRGRWYPDRESAADPRQAYREGKLKFRLEGEKLRGGWMLVRIKGSPGEEDKDDWLLFKERDDEARSGEEAAITARATDSALTGRTMEQIAAGADRVWTASTASSRDAAPGRPTRTSPARPTRSASMARGEARFRARLEPELATLVAEAPRGDDWLHEIKLDGYRVMTRLEKGKARLFTRRGADWTSHFPTLLEPVEPRAGAPGGARRRGRLREGRRAHELPQAGQRPAERHRPRRPRRLLRLRPALPGRLRPDAGAAVTPARTPCGGCCRASPRPSACGTSTTWRAAARSSSARPAPSGSRGRSPSGGTLRTDPAAAATGSR